MRDNTPSDTKIPYGFCQCGCGQKTRIARRTDSAKGWIKGKPLFCVLSHVAHRSGNTKGKPVTPIEDRFWKKVSKLDSGCWEWVGCRIHGKWKYGQINRGPRGRGSELAHRVSWEIHNGPIPDGMQVLHRCDNPPRINPDHLFLGTQSDNLKDMYKKGRR